MPFNRYLPELGLKLLEQKPQWWQDVLEYRFLVQGKARPLLLAVRDGSLNAYVEGQSVLKIEFNILAGNATLGAKIHEKYVNPQATGQKYLTFNGQFVGDQFYNGDATFCTWAERARSYDRHPRSPDKPTEKEGVAAIACNNSNVVDLEMGQNGTGDRIDIVALERDGEDIAIVFYEAKLLGNSQSLRANNFKAKVHAQLQKYRVWLSAQGRDKEIREAYRRACDYVIRFNATRKQPFAIDDLIEEAAKPDSRLKVDLEPRLIIFGSLGQGEMEAWAPHKEALRKAGVRLIIEEFPENVKLPRITPPEESWLL